MQLNDALRLLAERLNLDADDLIAFAAEDKEGGRGGNFSGWAIDVDEGKLLYALVRALQPASVLEVGTNEGASANHLLAALSANKAGALVSFDTNAAAGALIPDGYRPAWEFRNEDASVAVLPDADFVFEDGDHSLAGALATLQAVKTLKPHIVISHDYAMTTDYGDFHVKEAFDTVFPEGFSIVLDGCERGLGIWVNPDWQAPELEPVPEAPKKTPTRKPAAKRKS